MLEAIKFNGNKLSARFDLAELYIKLKNWGIIRELLEPVYNAKYRYARTVWYLLREAVNGANKQRAEFYYNILMTANIALDPEFVTLRNTKKNKKLEEIEIWLQRNTE